MQSSSSSLQQYFANLAQKHGRPQERITTTSLHDDRQYPISVSSIVLISDPARSPPPSGMRKKVIPSKLINVTPKCSPDKKKIFDRWNNSSSGNVSSSRRSSADDSSSSSTTFSSPVAVAADHRDHSSTSISRTHRMRSFRAPSLPTTYVDAAVDQMFLTEDRRWSDGIQPVNDSIRACTSADDTHINYCYSSGSRQSMTVAAAQQHPPSPTPQHTEQRRRQQLRRYKSMDSSSHNKASSDSMRLRHSLPIVTRVESYGDLSTTSSGAEETQHHAPPVFDPNNTVVQGLTLEGLLVPSIASATTSSVVPSAAVKQCY